MDSIILWNISEKEFLHQLSLNEKDFIRNTLFFSTFYRKKNTGTARLFLNSSVSVASTLLLGPFRASWLLRHTPATIAAACYASKQVKVNAVARQRDTFRVMCRPLPTQPTPIPTVPVSHVATSVAAGAGGGKFCLMYLWTPVWTRVSLACT